MRRWLRLLRGVWMWEPPPPRPSAALRLSCWGGSTISLQGPRSRCPRQSSRTQGPRSPPPAARVAVGGPGTQPRKDCRGRGGRGPAAAGGGEQWRVSRRLPSALEGGAGSVCGSSGAGTAVAPALTWASRPPPPHRCLASRGPGDRAPRRKVGGFLPELPGWKGGGQTVEASSGIFRSSDTSSLLSGVNDSMHFLDRCLAHGSNSLALACYSFRRCLQFPSGLLFPPPLIV